LSAEPRTPPQTLARDAGALAPGRRLSRRRLLAAMPALCALHWRQAPAAEGSGGAPLDRPAGPVVLTVTGRVAKPNAGAAAQFDMAMLERLPQQSFVTRTPWHSGAHKFTGPLLRDVLDACGAQGSNVRAVALCLKLIDLPFDDALRYDVLVARLLDDQPMAVRDKGPLFVIYPFDARPELRSTVYYGRSAWQLKTLDVQ
jgi:hypothetical protein